MARLTIVERATQFTLSVNLPSKSADNVAMATISLLTPFKDHALHTITADNGKEFAYHEDITDALGATVYFANPYHSWERGLNENTNGLLRQYWPKSTDFKKVSEAEVDDVIAALNDRPRKTLGYQTPARLMHQHMQSRAA